MTNKCILSGIEELDNLIGGFNPHELILIAGKPSTGKTQLIIDITLRLIDCNKKVAFFTLELTNEQLISRMLSIFSGVKSEKLRSGEFSDEELEKIISCASKLEKSNFMICDTPAISINELEERCKYVTKNNKLDLVIIDYLQLMRGNSENGKRNEELMEIQKYLRKISSELNIPIIVTAQLNKYYKIENKIDLKSSFIEPDIWDKIVILENEEEKSYI